MKGIAGDVSALADTKMMVAIKQPKLLELLSSKEFLEMLNNATFVRSIGNPDVCNKLCSPPAVEGLIAGVASSLDAQIASLDELMHSLVGLPDLGALQLPGARHYSRTLTALTGCISM